MFYTCRSSLETYYGFQCQVQYTLLVILDSISFFFEQFREKLGSCSETFYRRVAYIVLLIPHSFLEKFSTSQSRVTLAVIVQ